MEKTDIPNVLLDQDGYPTNEWLQFIKDYTSNKMPIMDFIKILERGWWMADWGVVLHRKYNGVRKLELHTGGWSGNEEVIDCITSNTYLTHLDMRYVSWRTGGHYYFEITIK